MCLSTTPRSYEIKLQAVYNQSYLEVSDQLPAPYPRGNSPGTHGHLDAVQREIFLPLPGIEPQS